MKSKDIDLLPDEVLESAVCQWLFAKIDSKGTTEVPIIMALPKPCTYFYSVYVVTEEIFNGGFSQMYINNTRFFSRSAMEGFYSMGANDACQIMEKANKIYQEYIKDDDSIIRLAGICEIKELEELTTQFTQCEDIKNLSQFIIKYIRDNKDFFGD